MTTSADRTRARPRHPAHWLAFGFGAGLSPYAPGTVGTAVAVPLYLALQYLTPISYFAVVLGLFLLGVWACGKTAHDLGDKDPAGVVWDEVVGYLVAMFMAPPGWAFIAVGFVLFRVFDIFKPYPIYQLQSAPGGWGVILDDVLAGIYTALVLHGIAWLTI